MTESLPIVFRDAGPDDLQLVADSWCKSYARSNWAAFFKTRGQNYTRAQDRLLKRILGRGARLIIAAWSEGPELILGWACYEGSTLHYVWVREQWQGKGVARAMIAAIPEPPKTITHLPARREGVRDLHGMKLDLGSLFG